MRHPKIKLLLLLALLPLALGACSKADAVENQAYALVMGVDRTDGGGVRLTITVPKIGGSGKQSDEGGAQNGDYLLVSASGDSYAQALEHLNLSVTRNLNLSQLKLLIASDEIARNPSFPALIEQIAQTHHLYTAARFAVCAGSARDFMRKQDAIIGTRLSNELDSMLRHYADQGYIPDSNFAEVFYQTHSVYSDPVAIWCFEEDAADGAQPASVIIESGGNIQAHIESPSGRTYMGAAIFRDGVLSGRLDAAETLVCNLIRRKGESFHYMAGSEICTLSQVAPPKKRVVLDGDSVAVALDISLSTIDRLSPAAAEGIERELENSVEGLVRKCQSLALEPFGFAQKAAAYFLTLGEWQAYDWRNHFANAKIDVHVALAYSEY